jgi:hypothetical protein
MPYSIHEGGTTALHSLRSKSWPRTSSPSSRPSRPSESWRPFPWILLPMTRLRRSLRGAVTTTLFLRFLLVRVLPESSLRRVWLVWKFAPAMSFSRSTARCVSLSLLTRSMSATTNRIQRKTSRMGHNPRTGCGPFVLSVSHPR